MAWIPPDFSPPQAWRRVYVYLRTPYALPHAYKSITEFEKSTHWRGAEVLWLSNDETWTDGFVFRGKVHMDAVDLAGRWQSTLEGFDAWAILDDKGGFKESATGGPMSRFFENTKRPDTPKINYSQIFLRWNEENPWSEESVDNIKTALKRFCIPVFFFRDGLVLFLESEEAGQLTVRRCPSHFNKFLGWCIVDSAGETFSSESRDDKRWEWAYFEDLTAPD